MIFDEISTAPAPSPGPIPEEIPVLSSDPGIDELINDINRESGPVKDDDFSAEPIPDFSELTPEPDPEPTPGQRRRAKSTAEFVVKTSDDVISRLFALYAKTDDPEPLRADESDLKDIAQHFESYFAETNFNMPPWLMGTVVAVFVLADKFKVASQLRKVNIELETERAERQKLEKEIEILKKEKELNTLKITVNNLRKETEPAAL